MDQCLKHLHLIFYFHSCLTSQFEFRFTEFIELLDITNGFKDKVETISKNSDNIEVISRVSRALSKLSGMITYYITKTYPTKTYTENKSDFYYCLWILDRLDKLICTILPKEVK